jgi:hypothetical protein
MIGGGWCMYLDTASRMWFAGRRCGGTDGPEMEKGYQELNKKL